MKIEPDISESREEVREEWIELGRTGSQLAEKGKIARWSPDINFFILCWILSLIMLELSVLGIHLFVAALYSVSASKTGELRVIIFYNHRQSWHSQSARRHPFFGISLIVVIFHSRRWQPIEWWWFRKTGLNFIVFGPRMKKRLMLFVSHHF